MANSFSGYTKSQVNASLVIDLDLVDPTIAVAKPYQINYTNGTGANKAQVIWSDTRALDAAGGATPNETLDLAALATGIGSATVNISKLKCLILRLSTTTAGYTLKLKAGASNGFAAIFSDPSDELVLQAGGGIQLDAPVDGYTVDGTHKTILITNPSAGAVSYDIIAIGEGSLA